MPVHCNLGRTSPRECTFAWPEIVPIQPVGCLILASGEEDINLDDSISGTCYSKSDRKKMEARFW